jgi:hypothetical protein
MQFITTYDGSKIPVSEIRKISPELQETKDGKGIGLGFHRVHTKDGDVHKVAPSQVESIGRLPVVPAQPFVLLAFYPATDETEKPYIIEEPIIAFLVDTSGCSVTPVTLTGPSVDWDAILRPDGKVEDFGEMFDSVEDYIKCRQREADEKKAAIAA